MSVISGSGRDFATWVLGLEGGIFDKGLERFPIKLFQIIRKISTFIVIAFVLIVLLLFSPKLDCHCTLRK